VSYSAMTFNVMIASPGDVASERAIVRDVVYEWNAVHSSLRKIVLLPIGWESHASPEMGATAQEIINHQVLQKCDLLIGVFWTRIGTATDDYSSGTVEEIERHIEAGRPAMLYFSSQPVAIDSVDMAQVEKLKHFKESCRSRGLYEGYDSHADFRATLYRHLQLKVNEHPLFRLDASLAQGDVVEPPSELPRLSPEARTLLKAASMDPQGMIMHLQYGGGAELQTNGRNLLTSNDRRDVAKWEEALQELVRADLILARGQEGEVFEVSNLGYQIADMITL
jgi:hypothetical protein